LLLVNLLIGLTPAGKTVPLAGWFAGNHPPEYNQNFDEISRLLNTIQSSANPGDVVYTAASSAILNDDILWQAERMFIEDKSASAPNSEVEGLHILRWVPFVDSRDDLPLSLLMQSQFVVVADPFQYHLMPEEQDLVRMVVEMFDEPWEFAADFERLPEEFEMNGVSVRIYHRVRPTTIPLAVKTLKRMEQFLNGRPTNQSPWINLGDRPGFYQQPEPSGGSMLLTDLDRYPAKFILNFMSVDSVVKPVRISADGVDLGSECVNASARFEVLDAVEIPVSTAIDVPDLLAPFETVISPVSAGYIHFRLSFEDTAESYPRCWFRLRGLRIEPLEP
jgi:hypothetical protein